MSVSNTVNNLNLMPDPWLRHVAVSNLSELCCRLFYSAQACDRTAGHHEIYQIIKQTTTHFL